MDIEEPEGWELEEKSRNRIKWGHKNSSASVVISYRIFSGWTYFRHDSRSRQGHEEEINWKNNDNGKGLAYDSAIKYMRENP